ncbi:MAG TPA: VCBS repeat-containing protein [Ilumatobacteraceae bacterium]|nr:VCBS repeat-containing protein [Ilumatobacteraceae bacterium]
MIRTGHRPLRRIPPGIALAAVMVLAACGGEEPTDSAPGSASAAASDEPSAAGVPSESAPAGSAFAGAWVDATADTIGETAEYTNRVELADLDADGDVDILFANGGGYEAPEEPEASRVFLNTGDGTFEEATDAVMGDFTGATRVIKVADLDGDGGNDILLGTTYETQSQLLLSSDSATWTNATADHLPAVDLSVGDLELGDVDADGDLDVMLAHWGNGGSPFEVAGVTQLWLNDGAAHFTDVTADRMPQIEIGFSWDLDLVDVDNDWDLDALVSCKVCEGSRLYLNDGTGMFTDATAGNVPAFGNNYEFAPIDLDADGFLDLVTINDGPDAGQGFSEHAFRNEGGTFTDATDAWWPPDANVGFDDATAVPVDIDSDGDADFLVTSLDGPDRLLLNDGTGTVSLVTDVFISDGFTAGTLAIGLADLNRDGRLDAVESQGEVPGYENEHVYFGTDRLPLDTAPPTVRTDLPASPTGDTVIHARVHDNGAAYGGHLWRSVEVRWDGGSAPMRWYGEFLFSAQIPFDPGVTGVEVCATDAAGNDTCVAGG